MRRSPARIEFSTVLRQTVREVSDDNAVGLAAQLAFYFLLALFPALLFLVALIGYLPIDDTVEDLLRTLGVFAPRELVVLLRRQLELISAGNAASLLTLGFAGAVWSSSAAMVAIIDALNRAYDLTERRTWWKRRIVAILLTTALALFVIVAQVFVLLGPAVTARWTSWLGLDSVVILLWQALRWPVILFCMILAINFVYHFAPNRRQAWRWLTPGSVLAAVLWVALSFCFKWYVSTLGNYAATYGVIAGAVVTMLWFYISSLALLVGAELNGVIEQTHRPRSHRLPHRPRPSP